MFYRDVSMAYLQRTFFLKVPGDWTTVLEDILLFLKSDRTLVPILETTFFSLDIPKVVQLSSSTL